MTPSTLNWAPDPKILQALEALGQKRGQSLEALLTEAIVHYLETQTLQEPASLTPKSDPLIGLFAGSPDLATQSETILQQEITPSGWTWK